MHEFIRFVLSKLGSGIWLAVLVVLPVMAAVVWHQRRRGGKLRWGRLVPIVLLAGYLAVVAYATISRPGGVAGVSGFNFQLFRAWREAWNNFSVKSWANVLLNVALFVPLGILLPLVFPKCRGLWMAAAALGATLLIECVQLLGGMGIFDVDDIFANFLGALMGHGLLLAALALRDRKWDRGAVFFLLTLVPVVAVSGLFVAYSAQPYGNLPEDWISRVDTGDVEWTLACELPRASETAAVYRAGAMTTAECEAVARAFAEGWGGEYDDIYHYDEETYFRDYDTDGWMYYLTVNRLNGGFDLWAEDKSREFDPMNGTWAELDRAGLEAVLAQYGITAPAEAEFFSGPRNEYDPNEIWYGLRAEELVTADGLLDGGLRLRMAEDGSYLDLVHGLVNYAYCAEEPIITPEKAYQQMCDGYFNGGWFEYQDPEAVTVVSCILTYAIDTKGFYQPVYRFEVTAPDWDGGDSIMISAIA